MALPDLVIRPASTEDVDVLGRALAWAIEWRSASLSGPPAQVVRDTGHAYLLSDWGKGGDTAFVAELGGQPIGAAWYRFWTTASHSYGFVGDQIPELGVGIDPAYRGIGVGSALLGALLLAAHAAGITEISLSVEGDNPAMRLYERLSFRRHHRVDESWTMVASLDE